MFDAVDGSDHDKTDSTSRSCSTH